jgi:phosphatidate cytidylyltransferase
MTDQDHPDDGLDPGRVEEPRSEGVRIIGAQEAAEAAGRPDVARRRRRGEKRYGDRPDEPEPATDLPKVRISTSEPDPGDRFGAVPVVPVADEPRWADGSDTDDQDGFAAVPDQQARPSMGHARALPREEADVVATGPDDGVDEWAAPHDSDGGGVRFFESEPDEAQPADGYLTDGGFEEAGDDSFVLPHWTEPPTGQVPKVVIGDDAQEEEPTGSSASQPRWRDEGERTVETDFDDLVDDAPRLGALGAEPLPDPDLDAGFFDGEADRDPLEAFAPEEEFFADERPVRRRTASRRRGAAASGALEADGFDDDFPVDDEGPRRPARTGGDGGSGGDRNLVVAIAVGVGLVALGLFSFWLGGLATTVLACVVVGAAAFEFFSAVEARGFRPAALLGLVAVVGLLLATYFFALAAYPVVLTLAVVLGLVWYLWVAPGDHSVRNLGITLLGVMWIGFLGSFATLFLGLGKTLQDADPRLTSNPGIGVLIAAIIAAVSHDVGAYFVGRYAGKTPLSAASPNKTMEGLAGGVVSSIVVTVILVGIVGIAPIGGNLARVMVFALLCAVVAPLGDLCESFVKRDLELKDMGSLLPGHGGVLDRFDALLFVLPTAYFVTVLFDIWG